MSRIGKNPIKLPEAVKYVENNNDVSVTGPKGTLGFKFPKDSKVNNENG
jgi:ribosomal protein L6P/L9E